MKLEGRAVASAAALIEARGAVLYVIGYFLTLAPVLIISKYETQYLYAPSLAISVAVALIWRPQIAYAVPTIGIAAALIYHVFLVQKDDKLSAQHIARRVVVNCVRLSLLVFRRYECQEQPHHSDWE